ncbi:MAG TPA: DUF4421 family protein, partial [Chitinophagales bacterium]|nr:DUF4421 family protein [Chitinophagales bacterium]
MKKKFIAIIVIALGVAVNCHKTFAQQSSLIPPDTNYIGGYSSKWSVRVFSALKTNTFYLFHSNWNHRISFIPETKVAAGLGLSFRDLAIDLGWDVYKSSVAQDQHTTGFNFIGSMYSNQNVVDVTFQINNGFTESADIEGKTVNIARNDINVFNFGVNYNYLFNYRRFSFNSSFIGTKIQKRSAGSPMIGGFFSNISITGKDSIIPLEFSSLFDPNQVTSQATVFSGGLTGGYAYTFVFPHHFMITLSLTPGITFSLGESQRDSLNLFQNLVVIAPKLVTRDAIGYAGKTIYAALSFGLDLNATILGDKNLLLYTPEKIKFVVGYRI